MLSLEVLLVASLVLWCAVGVLNLWSFQGSTTLRPEDHSAPLTAAPKVSIIVPARNEEITLPAALESSFKLDYPNYDVTLVDDDSTDHTAIIADDRAQRPEFRGRLKVIHNHQLPRGWTGKVHALHLAARVADGEWILATDADVVFHPALLRLALGCALRQKAALISLAPEFERGTLANKIILPAFSLLLTTLYPVRIVNNPRHRRALATGAFILMRRRDLEELGGYARLRNTVIEDLRVAELFKRNGRRIYLALTRGLLRTRTWESWWQLWEGLSRSAFEGSGFSTAKILAGTVFGCMVAVLPCVVVFARLARDLRLGHSPVADAPLLLAIASWSVSALVCLPFVRHFRASPLYALTLPLATLFYSAASINSVCKSVLGDGIPWKERRYRPPG